MEIILNNVRLSYPALFTARDYDNNGVFRWSAKFLIEKGSENDKKVSQALEAVAKENLGKDFKEFLEKIENNSQKCCYVKEGADYMALSAHRYVETKAGKNSRPVVIDKDKSPLTDDDGKPYGGCYVNAKVQIWYQGGKHSGMRCGFSVVQFSKDGEPFGNGAPSIDEFDDISDTGDDSDDLL